MDWWPDDVERERAIVDVLTPGTARIFRQQLKRVRPHVIRLDQVPEIAENGVVVSMESDHIGIVRRVLVHAGTGRITCVTVVTGWLRRTECFIPVNAAIIQLNEIRVPYDRSMVRRAPRAEFGNRPMTDAHSMLLLAYYGVTADRVTEIANFAEYRRPEELRSA